MIPAKNTTETTLIDPISTPELAANRFFFNITRPPFASIHPDIIASIYEELPESYRRYISAAIFCMIESCETDIAARQHLHEIAKIWANVRPDTIS